jgi:hypothetical protein
MLLGTNSFIKKHSANIKLAMRIVYFSFMLFKNKFTQGQYIYNVKLSPLTTGKTILYIFCKIVLPYLIQNIDDYLLKHDNFNNILKKLFKVVVAILKGLELFNFISFLTYNDYPSIWNRLLGLKYVNCLIS